jgi:hypothetical protein
MGRRDKIEVEVGQLGSDGMEFELIDVKGAPKDECPRCGGAVPCGCIPAGPTGGD